ncbi:putative P-loop containing nucleoside triphosphate hydrolase [Arabidopsis thaliana]
MWFRAWVDYGFRSELPGFQQKKEKKKTISQGRHSSTRRVLRNIKREDSNKQCLKNQKVLLVADDVTEVKQLEALAGAFSSFGPGSVVIITTDNKGLLNSYGIKEVYEVENLKFCGILRSLGFKKRAAAFQRALCRANSFATECFCCQSSSISGYGKVTDSV